MNIKPDSKADRDQDLDETIERQINTSGMTGVMQTLTSDVAREGEADTAGEVDDEFAETIAIPPAEQAFHG